jgi:cell division ATPase FtsA
VKVGIPRGVGGLTDEVQTARFAAAVGLVQYGWRSGKNGASRLAVGGRTGNGFYKMKNWIRGVVNQF